MHQKRKIYHILTGLLLIAAGLVLAAAYGVEDLYHLLKYGPGNYRNVYNICRQELWIKPLLFLFSGILYLKRKRLLFLLCVPAVLFLYMSNFNDIIWSAYYRLLTLSELLAFACFLALCFSDRFPVPLCRILPVNLEALSVLSSFRFIMNREYLVRIVSGVVFMLYKIPLLMAFVLMEMELHNLKGELKNGKRTG